MNKKPEPNTQPQRPKRFPPPEHPVNFRMPAPKDCPALITRQKRHAFDRGYPIPTEAHLAFRKLLAPAIKKYR